MVCALAVQIVLVLQDWYAINVDMQPTIVIMEHVEAVTKLIPLPEVALTQKHVEDVTEKEQYKNTGTSQFLRSALTFISLLNIFV